MAVGHTSKRGLALRGAVWGFGHTLTLLAICSAVIVFGFALTEQASAALEFAVGVMLVILGLDITRRMLKKKIHFHVHEHEGSSPHLHAHSHQDAEGPHASDSHEHKHPEKLPLRALLVGLVHGAAGSAGLIALAVAATHEPWMAVGYVVVFGIGSMIGMALLSFVAAWPMGLAERSAQWLRTGLHVGIALITIGIGVTVMVETGPTAWNWV